MGLDAADFLQRVGQDQEVFEASFVVNGLGKGNDIGRPPGRVEGDGTVRVAENVMQELALVSVLLFSP